MEQTLLLNATYEPLKVVNWQKAITLLCQGKVEVISVYDREIRAVSFSIKLPSVIRLLRYIRIKRRFDYVPFSRANIYARDNHACQYLRRGVFDERADVRPRRAGGARRPQGLGEHRHLLRLVQPPERRAHAGRSGHAPREVSRGGPSRCRRFALRSDCETRRTAGAISCTGTQSSTNPDGLTRLTSIQPHWAVEGGRVAIHGSGFPVDRPHLPDVTIGEAPARAVYASPSTISCSSRLASTAAAPPCAWRTCRARRRCSKSGTPLATGLHQVDNPVFDREGNLYVTYSGTPRAGGARSRSSASARTDAASRTSRAS